MLADGRYQAVIIFTDYTLPAIRAGKIAVNPVRMDDLTFRMQQKPNFLQPLILVRHGQAEHQVKDITGGWSDTVLTDVGEEQVRLLADRLRRELNGVAPGLCASSLRRARQTADILAHKLRLSSLIFPELADLNNGTAAGLTRDQASWLALPQTDPAIDWRPYPQAETWREFYSRTTAFMDEFSSNQAGPTILVTHFANIDVITSWWLGLAVDSYTHFEIDPASLTVLTISKYGERAVERLNDTAHLYASGHSEPIRLINRQ